MTRAILQSINENEANYLELSQILMDYIQNMDYEAGDTIFLEEKCNSKEEYIAKEEKKGIFYQE